LKEYEIACQSGNVSTEKLDAIMSKASINAQKYAVNIKEGTGSAKLYAQAQRESNAALQATSVGATVTTGAVTALRVAMNSIGIGLLVTGLSKLAEVIYERVNNAIHKFENYIEDADNLLDDFNSDIEDITSKQSTIENLIDDFNKLSKGVDQNGRNISLTADEYSKYQDILETIAGVNPNIIKGYDAENNILADKNSLLETTVQLLKDEYKQRIQNLAASDNVETAINGAVGRYKDARDEYEDAIGNIPISTQLVQYVTNGKKNGFADIVGDAIGKEFNIWDYSSAAEFIDENIDLILENMDKIKEEFSNYDFSDNQLIDLMDYFKNINILYGKLDTAAASANSTLQYVAVAEESYSDLSDVQKKFISDYVNNIKITDDMTEEEKEAIRKSIILTTQELSKLTVDSDMQKALTDFYSPQADDESINDYQNRIKNSVEEIQTYCDENGITIPVTTKKADDLKSNYDKAIAYAKENLKESATDLSEYEQNLQDEYQKIQDWGLDDYEQQIKDGAIQSKFGNVDMDKRTIIEWSNELKETYKDELASWDYDPEIGSIDTVFGGSNRFGEELNGVGWEVAFTPVLPDGTFLSQDTVYDYINSILEEAYADDGQVTEDELTAIDAQGRQIGNTFVQGIFAGIDESQDYDNNGNWAETIGRLMHFSGKFGAPSLAKQAIEESQNLDEDYDWESWMKEHSINTDEEVSQFMNLAQAAKEAGKSGEEFRNEWGKTTDKTDTPSLLSITDTVDKLDTKFKPAFDDLKSAYQDIFSLDDNGNRVFDLNGVDIDTLSSIKSAIDSMNEIDGVNIATETFEEFSKVLTDTASTAEDVQEQFNNLVSEMLNQSNIVNVGMNTDVLRQSLEKLGVTNVDDVLSDIINAERELVERGIDLENVTNEEAGAFLNEAEASDISKQYLKAYLIQKELAENPLSTTDDIKSLEALCEAIGTTGEMYKQLSYLKYLYNTLENSDKLPSDVVANLKNQVSEAQEKVRQIANNEYTFEVNFDTADFEYDGLKDKVDDFNSSTSKSNSETAETFDWIAVAIERVQEALARLTKVRDNTYKTWSERNQALSGEISNTYEELSLQQSAFDAYMQAFNEIDLSDEWKQLIANGGLRIDEITDSDLKEQIKDAQDFYEKAIDCSDAIEDLKIQLSDLAKTRFDNLNTAFENQLSLIEERQTQLDNAVSNMEEHGYAVASILYENSLTAEKENLAGLYNQRNALVQELNSSVESGDIEAYSEAWYDLRGQIAEVTSSIQQSETTLVELNQTIRELEWDNFDGLLDTITRITDESNFLIDILEDEKLFDDNGNFTNEGLATVGLHGINWETEMRKAQEYAVELEKIQAEIADDPNNQTLIDRQRELQDAQWDCVESANEEKQAMIELAQEGIQKAIDAMQELINTTSERISKEKDLYDFQKTVAEKTKTISNLQKQLNVIELMRLKNMSHYGIRLKILFFTIFDMI
jgi:hypothetical protein